MKYYPGFNRFDLFDDFFSDATTKTANVLKTDIHEKDGYYVLSMEAPGVKKEDIQIFDKRIYGRAILIFIRKE